MISPRNTPTTLLKKRARRACLPKKSHVGEKSGTAPGHSTAVIFSSERRLVSSNRSRSDSSSPSFRQRSYGNKIKEPVVSEFDGVSVILCVCSAHSALKRLFQRRDAGDSQRPLRKLPI